MWICADPRGHLDATGRDLRGRKQYRYHPRWRATRDETKYEHMVVFRRALPRQRRRVEQDLRRQGLPREKVLAAVVRLMECAPARILKNCRDLPGAELFQYLDEAGARRSTDVERALMRVLDARGVPAAAQPCAR